MKPKTYVCAGLGLLVVAFSALYYPAVGEFTGLYCAPRKLHDIRPPAESASPEEVVRAYLRAVMARDLDTARHLSTSEFADREESVYDSSFCDWTSLGAVTVWPAHPDVDGTGRYTTVMRVSVELELQTRGRDASEDFSWGYLLERASPKERWRIFDSGEG
ncbi:hypothetical protein ABZ297_10390 [Nonomuraea sp. NPDC005983]|uniref:hypothetical protein n=1 Tax=Nonomuraea sp. NPDC005983 TaxID=3155595 RepID=UPI0033A31467